MHNFLFILSYILIFVVLFYTKPLVYCERSRNDKYFIFVTMGLMLLLNCLRGETVGNDTFAYKSLFSYYIGHGSLIDVSDAGIWWMNEYIEVGYRYINVFFSRISNSYQLLISAIAIFLYGVTTRFIYNESENVPISVILFFFLFYHPFINVLRQGIAITIILIGFQNLRKEKYIRFIIFVLFAALFHRTAIVALAMIPLMLLQTYSFKRAIFLIALSILLSLTNAFTRIVMLLGYSGRYLKFEAGLSTYAQLALSVIFFLFFNYLRGNGIKKYISGEMNGYDTKKDRFYSRIPLIHVCLSIAGLNVTELSRCSYYFTVFYLAGVPYVMMNSKRYKSNIRAVLFFLMLALIIYHIGVLLFRPEWFTEFQYQFFWQE